ncbi:hypothetical protein JCM6882_004203 [Rhodosporidiobolus microsporus]
MPSSRHHQYAQTPTDVKKPNRNQRQCSRDCVPWTCAAWLQAQSKDLLPSFVMGPAIIGAVFSALAGGSCVAGYFMLKKGETYHAKHVQRNPDVRKQDLKHQKHPIHFLALAILILGISTFVTAGAYYYMVACILIDNSEDYCLAIAPATSAAECNKSVSFLSIGAGAILLIALSGFAWKYHDVIDEGYSFFNFQRQLHGLDTDNEEDMGGGGRRGMSRSSSRASSRPPSYMEKGGDDGYYDQQQGGDGYYDDQYGGAAGGGGRDSYYGR